MKIIISLLFSVLSLNTFALECFEFKFKDFPDKSPINSDFEKKETWCYKSINLPKFQTMIINFDGKEISENLGILVGKDENFLFFDQLLGKVRTIEQNKSIPNPYQIPLSAKDNKDLKKVQFTLTKTQDEKIEKMISKMINSKIKILVSPKNLIEEELKNEEVYLPADKVPTDGYWWPYRGAPMANIQDSPTKLYDLFVKMKTGQNPNATGWEQTNHSLDNVYWGGHCNGWAASAILDGFYDKTLILKTSDDEININPYQIQGMRTETGFCVKLAFYGNRYRGPGDDPRDIAPDLFHKTIRYYLKELGKPLALDRIATDPVDTSIFSGYKITVEKVSTNKYYVIAAMKTHYYNYAPVNVKKPATAKMLTYRYYLYTDNNGAITGGQWDADSPNPDFLWSPLAQMKCGRENPNMDPKYIDEMIETLPKAP